jgi:histidine triad (HIT) family protein
MSDSLFTKIIKREIPAKIIYEDDKVIGIQDIYPQAKVHLLFIHKTPTKDINELVGTDPLQLQDVFKAIHKYTNENGLTDKGFRIVNNCGEYAGQTVFHTHFHVLGGEPLKHFGA